MSAHNLFNTLQQFDLGNGMQGSFYSLPALEKAGIGPDQKQRFYCDNFIDLMGAGLAPELRAAQAHGNAPT